MRFWPKFIAHVFINILFSLGLARGVQWGSGEHCFLYLITWSDLKAYQCGDLESDCRLTWSYDLCDKALMYDLSWSGIYYKFLVIRSWG